MARYGGKWWHWAALAAALVLAGCTCWWCGHALEPDYGRSVANNTAQQLVNPQAGSQAIVAAPGLTPRAGQNTLEKYEKTFKAEEKKGQELKLTQ